MDSSGRMCYISSKIRFPLCRLDRPSCTDTPGHPSTGMKKSNIAMTQEIGTGMFLYDGDIQYPSTHLKDDDDVLFFF